ncbi:MAG: hypothetical protein ABEJ04_06545 [Halobacteriaceae archaeon]
MNRARGEATSGVLNETTNTVHKHETEGSEFETECGLTHHVAPERLRKVPVERAVASERTSRCGRCFSEAGGY